VTVATAPGKVILLGEHAVVYGQPAIAVPVTQVQARAEVRDNKPGLGVTVVAADLARTFAPFRLQGESPAVLALARTVHNTLAHLGYSGEPDLLITISSTVPIGRGLGSGAAVAAALVRALAAHLGASLTPGEVSELVYQTEMIHHGSPSGIDNAVIAFGQPLYFVRGECAQVFAPGRPLTLLIADSGLRAATRDVVASVRERWQADPESYEAHFAAIGRLVRRARQAIAEGNLAELGRLMDANQEQLVAIDVSSPELDLLIAAARAAGALGAKLSGSGRGGNMIALVEDETQEAVRAALGAAGARSIVLTRVE